MISTPSIPFREALAVLAKRRVLPTAMTTAQLRQLDDLVRRQSFYSAQTTLVDLLDGYKADVERILNADLDVPTARLQAKQRLAALNYQPDEEKRGSIEDLSSDARINLVVRTNRDMMQGAGVFIQGQDDALLYQYPALELYRGEDRVQKRSWGQIWNNAIQTLGEATTAIPVSNPKADNGMFALKNDPIWQELGNAEDGLGNPFPPFRFRSGLWTRNVRRDRAIEMGLLKKGETVQPNLKPVFGMFKDV